MKIEGIPGGYDIVRIGKPVDGELVLGWQGDVFEWGGGANDVVNHVILRKIERPKQYRPFANAEEFKPHQLRFWRWKTDSESMHRPPQHYFENGWNSRIWKSAYDDAVFADGTPFGVEVSDED
jgi:hypothetical protein